MTNQACESGKSAGKFKGDKNSDEKFYQRFSKVLFVLKCFSLKSNVSLFAVKYDLRYTNFITS